MSPVIRRLKPKSATFTKWFSPTKQLRAAKSLEEEDKMKVLNLDFHEISICFFSFSFSTKEEYLAIRDHYIWWNNTVLDNLLLYKTKTLFQSGLLILSLSNVPRKLTELPHLLKPQKYACHNHKGMH